MTDKCSQGGRLALLCTIILLFSSQTAMAQTPTLAECAAIQSDNERLACYDRISGARPAAPEEPAAPSELEIIAPSEPVAAASVPAPSLIDAAWGFAPDAPKFILATYRPNYLLFARYTDSVNDEPFSPLFEAAGSDQDLDSVEAVFQISFKTRLWTTDDRQWGAWIAYTQQSHWQVYNDDISRPFRETNYMPEILVSYRPAWNSAASTGGCSTSDSSTSPTAAPISSRGAGTASTRRLASNAATSRSWPNPGTASPKARGTMTIRTSRTTTATANSPRSTRRGTTAWRSWGAATSKEGKGAAQFTWMSPPLLGPLRAYVKGFTGYGESMIDYNWNQSTIGAGFALNDTL